MVVFTGLTLIGFIVWLVDQVYVLAPLAVSVVVCPLQIVGEFTLTIGSWFTVTVEVAVFEHPVAVVVPVTV